MPDISLCSNETCLLRDTCYRKQAKPNLPYQYYTPFHPINEDPANYECVMYLEIPN